MPTERATEFDSSKIKDQALRDLCNVLEGVRGKKSLVVDKSLSGPLGLIAQFSLLQDYGVVQLHWVEDNNIDYSTSKNILYIARCTAKNAYSIASQIKNAPRIPGQDFEHSLFFVPRRTPLCDRILEDEGVFGDVTINEYPLYFIPLEPDVLSLELDDAFEDLYLHKTYTSIFNSAKALMLLQQQYGLFPRITGQGNKGKRLLDALIRMKNEAAAEDASTSMALAPSSIIENLIIIDREVDLVTPLLTQLTYEGLVDEIFGINNSHVELEASLIGSALQTPTDSTGRSVGVPAAPQAKKRKVLLEGSDRVFSELRDVNFSAVPAILKKTALRIDADFKKKDDCKTVSEMKAYVTKVLGPAQKDRTSLSMHFNIAEVIQKHINTELFEKTLEVQQSLIAGYSSTQQNELITELIARGASLETVLRLLCLYSCVNTGFKPKDFDLFRREILQGYGYEHVLTLTALDTVALLQSRITAGSAAAAISRTNYDYLRKPLKLFSENVNESDPDDIVYVYSVYAPLSIRLVQCVIQKSQMAHAARGGGGLNPTSAGWKGFEDVVKHVSGKSFDEVQKGEDKAVRARMILDGQNEKKVTVVFFLGGITYTEIAALRWLAKREDGKSPFCNIPRARVLTAGIGRRQIIIATTGIINGNKIIRAATADAQTKPPQA
ncbi:hypothetical protein DRE_05978 [Drechslerella stenobrocha 248]|uniref:Vacuolar protein sorting-associated protein 33A n=1 Tax=Drechslerella stenobrocha 248 TaxID=1043628 RepID=W7HMN2_9PEZI|nr:hypothetical protein DRE_05978 [Drechslerella stenobrocha 248]